MSHENFKIPAGSIHTCNKGNMEAEVWDENSSSFKTVIVARSASNGIELNSSTHPETLQRYLDRAKDIRGECPGGCWEYCGLTTYINNLRKLLGEFE